MTQAFKRELDQALAAQGEEHDSANSVGGTAAMLALHRQNKKLRTSSEDQDALNVLLRVALAEKQQQMQQNHEQSNLCNNESETSTRTAHSSGRSSSSAQKQSKKNMFLRRTQEQEREASASVSASVVQDRKCGSAEGTKQEAAAFVAKSGPVPDTTVTSAALSSLQASLSRVQEISSKAAVKQTISNENSVPLHVFLPSNQAAPELVSSSSSIAPMCVNNAEQLNVSTTSQTRGTNDDIRATSSAELLLQGLLNQATQENLNVEVERMIARHHMRRRRSFELLKAQRIMMLANANSNNTNAQAKAAALAAGAASSSTLGAFAASNTSQPQTDLATAHSLQRATSALQTPLLPTSQQLHLLKAILAAQGVGPGLESLL